MPLATATTSSAHSMAVTASNTSLAISKSSPASTVETQIIGGGLSCGAIGAIAGSIGGFFIIGIVTAGLVYCYRRKVVRSNIPQTMQERDTESQGQPSSEGAQGNESDGLRPESTRLRYPDAERIHSGRT